MVDCQAVSNVKKHYQEFCHEVGYYPHTSSVQAIWAIGGSIDEMGERFDDEDMQSTSSMSARYLTGDADGLVAIWRLGHNKHSELRLRLLSLLDVSLLLPRPVNPSVRSVTEREGTILIGTIGSEIFEIIDDNIPDLSVAFQTLKKKRTSQKALALSDLTSSKDSFRRKSLLTSSSVSALRLVSGHYQGELWGLAIHPSQPIYITCGDDGMLCCWSLVQHKLLSYMRLPEKLRAVDIDPIDGRELAVSLNSGAVWIIGTKCLFNPKNVPQIEIDFSLSGTEIDISAAVDAAHCLLKSPVLSEGEMKSGNGAAPAPDNSSEKMKGQSNCDIKILQRSATQWAQEVKYSFEGSLLAVGSHDGNIYIYDVRNNYALQRSDSVDGPGMKHDDVITHLDFGVILVNQSDRKITYDELTRKIVTSQLQTDKLMSPKSASDRPEFGSKISPTISSVTEGLEKEKEKEKEKERRKAKWVVLSSRDLCRSDICIQSTCGTGELLYWNLDGSKITSQELVKVGALKDNFFIWRN